MFTVTYSCGRCCQTFTNVKDQSEHTFNCGKRKTETKPVLEVEVVKEEPKEEPIIEKLEETEKPEKNIVDDQKNKVN